jgi:hypothetical protein
MDDKIGHFQSKSFGSLLSPFVSGGQQQLGVKTPSCSGNVYFANGQKQNPRAL